MSHIKPFKTVCISIASFVLVVGSPLTAFAAELPANTNQPGDTTTSANDSQSANAPQTNGTLPQESSGNSEKNQPSTKQTSQDKSADPTIDKSAPTPSTTQATDSIDKTSDTTTKTDTTNDTKIENTQKSDATSGDATVSQNGSAGNATTGNASSQTTVINSVHSTIGDGDKTGIAYFTSDINGNVHGDITIAPSINSATEVSNANMSSATNIDNNTSIDNKINATATSGDATVSQNGSAGSATTGNANTVANVMNLINTIISANKSFVGTINIYGDLDGDILVSPEFIPQLLGTNTATSTIDTSHAATLENNQAIVNNIKLNATSGEANITDNGQAGSATTGAAQTNLTVLNLTGHQVTAKNSLLVFVNVLGKWVGMIVDAPAGTTAAALGSGVTSNSITANSTFNVTDTAKITNTVDLSSKSGSATVSQNGKAGDATSGSATASANIANISASAFSVSDWFGVLFINVFGTWMGSFGVDTANGTVTPIATPEQQTPVENPAPFTFGFTPKLTSQNSTPAYSMSDSASGSSAAIASSNTAAPAMLTTQRLESKPSQKLQESQSVQKNPFNDVIMYAGFGIAAVGASIFALRRNS